jgi:hypothetical protein
VAAHAAGEANANLPRRERPPSSEAAHWSWYNTVIHVAYSGRRFPEKIMWKPIRTLASALALVFASSGLAIAEHEHGHADMGGEIAMGKGGHECGPMGMGGHGGSNLVATSDGGVVVRCGNELFKYDKNLKLVKQVEIECAKCCKKDSATAGGDMGMCHRPGKMGVPEKSMEPKKGDDPKAVPPAAPSAPAKK